MWHSFLSVCLVYYLSKMYTLKEGEWISHLYVNDRQSSKSDIQALC
jgi:hypothetical protein